MKHDAVTLTWDDPGDDSITGYQILRWQRGVHDPGDFQVHVNDTGSAAATYQDTEVEAGASYVYRIKAMNPAGLSKRSNHLRADLPQPPAVAVSFEQAAHHVTEGESVAVSVVLDTDPERYVSIPIVATDQGGASGGDHSVVPTEVNFTEGETRQVITLKATDDTEDDNGESVLLQFGSSLPDRVSAGSVRETTVSIADNDEPEPGAAPGGAEQADDITTRDAPGQVLNVTLPLIDGHHLRVEWTGLSDATSYRVQWRSGGETFANAAAGGRQEVIRAPATSHIIYDLDAGVSYTVRVIATNADGDGVPSNEVTGTTLLRVDQIPDQFPTSVDYDTIEDLRYIETSGDVDWLDFGDISSNVSRNSLIRVHGRGDDPSLTLEHPMIVGLYRASCDALGVEQEPDPMPYTEALGGGFFNGTSSTTLLRFDPQHYLDPCSNRQGDYGAKYYIAVTGYDGGVGSYRISKRETTRDDWDWTFGQDKQHGDRGAVTVDGGATSGWIGHEEDYDWFKFEAEAGQRYDVVLDGSHHSLRLLFVYHEGSDLDQYNERPSLDRDTGLWTIRFTAEHDGTHLFGVGILSNRSYFRYRHYEVWVKTAPLPLPPPRVGLETATSDLPATKFTRGRLQPGVQLTGYAHSGTDVDWYAFKLQAGRVYRFLADAQDSDSLTLDLLGVYDKLGRAIPGSSNSGGLLNAGDAALLFEPQQSGLHYLALEADKGGETDTEYRLLLHDLTGAPLNIPEPADDDLVGAGYGYLAVGGGISGSFGPVESGAAVDNYGVWFEAGKKYLLTFTALVSGHRLELVRNGGTVVEADEFNSIGGGNSTEHRYLAKETGLYRVRLMKGTAAGNVTYELDLKEIPPDEIELVTSVGDLSAGTDTLGRVRNDGVGVSGRLIHTYYGPKPTELEDNEWEDLGWEHDKDWFAVELQGGVEYRFDLWGAAENGLNSSLVWPPLENGEMNLYDSSGTYIDAFLDNYEFINDNHVTHRYTPNASGTYYVEVTYPLGILHFDSDGNVREIQYTLDSIDSEGFLVTYNYHVPLGGKYTLFVDQSP